MSAITNPRLNPVPAAPPVPPPATVEPEHGPPSRRWVWGLLALIIIGGVVGYGLWRKQQAAQSQTAAVVGIKTARASVGPVVQTVRLAGTTSSRDFVNVTAPIVRGPEGGREMILLFLAPSGSKVKKGELLAQIDAKSIEDHVQDIGDDIEQAQADINKRKAEQSIDWENLNQTLRMSKAEWDKAKLEAKATEVRTSIDQELLKLAAEEAEARYKQATADLKFKKEGFAAELRILEITKERHIRHRGRHANDIKRFKIFSPMDGLAVVQSTWRGSEYQTIQQGDQVSPGQLFMKVVNPLKMQVDANVNQAESSMFRIGQKATIEFDAFPGMTLPAHVYSIGALAAGGWRQQYYIRSIPVKLNIDGTDPRLIPDLSASGDVEIGQSKDGVRIPLAAAFKDNDKDVAFVKTAKGFEKRPVTLGLASNTMVAVTAGISADEEVALERPQGL